MRNEDTVEEREREKLGSRFDLKIWDFFFVYVAGSMEFYGLDWMIKCGEMG